MNAVAFLGSPRRGGNSETLLNEALRVLEGTSVKLRFFNLPSMNISPCIHCGGCDETGLCIIRDDMDIIADSIREASRIVIASPIFFFGLPAQVKSMIDRCQQFWCEKYLLKRPIPIGEEGRKGLLILVGGMKKDIGVRCSDATATAFFRTINVPEHRTLSFLGVDAKGDILKHPTALKDVYEEAKEFFK